MSSSPARRGRVNPDRHPCTVLEEVEAAAPPLADDPWWVVWVETFAIGACTFLGIAVCIAALILWSLLPHFLNALP
jgi:hypothetical protein